MAAFALGDAEIARRRAAILRLQQVTADLASFTLLMKQGLGQDGLALGPLAMAARKGWSYAQYVLIQAEGGMLSVELVEAIAHKDPAVACPNLRRLAETTLIAAEARLHGKPPARILREACR